jgi:hypothetical protein
MPGRAIDFTTHLNRKRQTEALKVRIEASGWDIDCDISSVDSEVCFYLIDSKESGIALFGCSKETIPEKGSPEIVHWGHFVLAWDVIADPDMPFDNKHKQNTMELAIRALPSLPEWQEFADRAFSTDGTKKPHILVLIDRASLDSPLELIVAHSESPVLNPESIQSIVDNYIKAN